MARASRVIVVVAAFFAVCHLRSHVFVAPPPSRKAMAVAPTAGLMACLVAAAPACADKIDDAAEILGTRAYPLLKSVDWNSGLFASLPGANPLQVLNVVDKCLIMGAGMNTQTLIKGVQEHSKAIASVDGNGVCSQQDFTYIVKAIGHMIASVNVESSMAVYDAAREVIPVNSGVPAYLMGMVNANDATNAYRGLLDFSSVVLEAAKFPR